DGADTCRPLARTFLQGYNNRSSMKLLPKRFINIHQWLGPICAKQLKETLFCLISNPGSQVCPSGNSTTRSSRELNPGAHEL
ncbi:hypothetical protein L9F63_014284, partial [Diploptera punctata]